MKNENSDIRTWLGDPVSTYCSWSRPWGEVVARSTESFRLVVLRSRTGWREGNKKGTSVSVRAFAARPPLLQASLKLLPHKREEASLSFVFFFFLSFEWLLEVEKLVGWTERRWTWISSRVSILREFYCTIDFLYSNLSEKISKYERIGTRCSWRGTNTHGAFYQRCSAAVCALNSGETRVLSAAAY